MKKIKEKIVSKNSSQVMVKWERLSEALSPSEQVAFSYLIKKLSDYDKSLKSPAN